MCITDIRKELANGSAGEWPQYGQLTYTGQGGIKGGPPIIPYVWSPGRFKAGYWQPASETPQTSFSPSEALSNEENRNMIDSLKIRKKKAQGMIAPNLKTTVTAPGKSGLNIAKG